MNGQYLDGKAIEVSYAYKKDSQSGEKHGSMAERVLASNRPNKLSSAGTKPGFNPQLVGNMPKF